MAFCPECGKAATGEATRCMHCGHELDSNAAAAKSAGARFKGTMMMSAPAVAKPAAKPAPAEPPAPAPAPVAAPVQAPAKMAPKQTMIGTGLGPLTGPKPAAAPAQPAAAAPMASAATPAPEAKRNMAFAQTQHQAAFAAVPSARAAGAPSPAIEPLGIAATPMAPRPEPEPARAPEHAQYDAGDEGNYLPGDPMAPQAAMPERAPVLRYDESMPELPRVNPLQDKKMLWIAAAV